MKKVITLSEKFINEAAKAQEKFAEIIKEGEASSEITSHLKVGKSNLDAVVSRLKNVIRIAKIKEERKKAIKKSSVIKKASS